MPSSIAKRLKLTETDEINTPTRTYIYTSQPTTNKADGYTGRLDVISDSDSPAWSLASVRAYLVDLFLPTGYPASVTEDYLPYQIFDSLQAFCSSIAGLLSSRAVLQGVGVGNAAASPTSALLLHILQDTSGRLATILFAHRAGTALEPECKSYRLAADVFNDVAMVLDCVSPGVPAGGLRVGVLSAAGVLRALCGVAGGAAKASLSAHFARWGNLAEVNAKDSSQETIISLVGMLVGSLVVSHVTSQPATWACLVGLLALHLSLNYKAVRAVQMTSLNRQRANIVFSGLLESDAEFEVDEFISGSQRQRQPQQPGPGQTKQKSSQTENAEEKKYQILTPQETSQIERIFESDGLLRWSTNPHFPNQHQRHHDRKLGFCQIGTPLSTFLQGTHTTTSSISGTKTSIPLQTLTTLFSTEPYILLFSRCGSTRTWEGRIALKTGCSVLGQLKAWMHALIVGKVLYLENPNSAGTEGVLDVIGLTLGFLNEDGRFERYMVGLKEAGWDLEIAALETRSGRRISTSVD